MIVPPSGKSASKQFSSSQFPPVKDEVSLTQPLLMELLLEGGIEFDPAEDAAPPSDDDEPDTVALRELNDHIVNDPRVEVAQLTLGDGVTMVRRR